MDANLEPSEIESDTLARLLDEQLWQLQRAGLRATTGADIPVLVAVANELGHGATVESRLRSLLTSTLDDAGRGVPEFDAARAWYGLTSETAQRGDLDRHIAAFQVFNELTERSVSYDAFRTRVLLRINQSVSYRIMLRYRHATGSQQGGAAPHAVVHSRRGALASGWTGPRLRRQTLPAPQWFVGRKGRLEELTCFHDAASHEEPPVAVITGTGGMGKTSFALRWAHLHSDRFPDGQLYLDFRGFHPSTAPIQAPDALRILLEMLEVDPKGVPATFESQLALYRRLTADQRLLLLADNVRDVNQVAALIPSGMGCMTLITSRSHLRALTRHHLHNVEIDRLSLGEARELLAGYLTSQRVAAEPQAVEQIVQYCGGMALALSIVASRARWESNESLEVFARQLSDTTGRLDILDTADPTLSIRAIMSWSYPLLSTDAAMAFRLMGSADGTALPIGAVCAVLGWGDRQTDRTLRALEDSSLIRQVSPGRFEMHDLVRLYAIERAFEVDSREFRTRASRRLASYYLHSADAADRLLAEFRRRIELPVADDGVLAEHPNDEREALAWFAREYENLVAAQQLAVRREWDDHVWAFAWTLDNYRWRSGLIHDDIAAWRLGLEAAAQSTLFARGLAHRRLGRAYGRAAEWGLALHHTRTAVAVAREAADEPGLAHSLRILSWLCERVGDATGSMDAARESCEVYSSLGNPVWTAHALSVLGDCHERADEEQPAQDCWERALALHREFGHDSGEAETLVAIGLSRQKRDGPAGGLPFLRQAAAIYQRLKDTYNEAGALERVGNALATLGEVREARICLDEALSMYHDHGRVEDEHRVRETIGQLQEKS